MVNGVRQAGTKQTFTVSSNRFYLDEGYPCPALDDTFERYNRMAEWAYNYKYDERFLGVRHGVNFTRDTKAHYAGLYGERLPDYICFEKDNPYWISNVLYYVILDVILRR